MNSTTKNKTILVLGLDPGTTRIGFGLISNDRTPKLIDCGVLSVSTKERNERIFQAIEHLKIILKKHKPSIVSLEKLFFVKNQKTGLQVAEMRGALLYAIREENINIVEYSPKEVKKSVTGDGNADKYAVAKMVKLTLRENIISGPDDVTDAIAVALTALYDIRNKLK